MAPATNRQKIFEVVTGPGIPAWNDVMNRQLRDSVFATLRQSELAGPASEIVSDETAHPILFVAIRCDWKLGSSMRVGRVRLLGYNGCSVTHWALSFELR